MLIFFHYPSKSCPATGTGTSPWINGGGVTFQPLLLPVSCPASRCRNSEPCTEGALPGCALPTSSTQEPFGIRLLHNPTCLPSCRPGGCCPSNPEPESNGASKHSSTFKVKGYPGHSRHPVFPSTQKLEVKDYCEPEASLSLLYIQFKASLGYISKTVWENASK